MTETRTWTEYAVRATDDEIDLVTDDLTYAYGYAQASEGDVVVQRTVTRTETEWGPVTCRYVTSLDKPCGRSTIHTGYCVLHDVLSRLDRMNMRELAGTTWTANPILDQVRLTIIKKLAPKACPACSKPMRRSTPEDAGVEGDDLLFPWTCDPCNVMRGD